jgi:hypothetical protein
MNERSLMGLICEGLGEVEMKENREMEKRVLKVESECEMMKRVLLGEEKVIGMIYGKCKLMDGRYRYEMYIAGEGTKRLKAREEKEKYEKYEMRRYVEEKRGGMKVRMEFI